LGDWIQVLVAVWRGFPGFIVSGLVECLLLVGFLDAAMRGKRIYGVAAFGMAAVLVARMAEGYMEAIPNTVMRVGGLLLAGAVVFIDLITEVVEDTPAEAEPE
jgi:hypothetical protein